MSSKKDVVVYKTLDEFYPFYLTEHNNGINRALHFIGTTLVMILAVFILVTGQWKYIGALPLCGYGFAWVGHFFFERNKPASFKYPTFSFICDFIMWYEIATGKIPMMPSSGKAKRIE